jgi:CRP-like cAMP-binding protein
MDRLEELRAIWHKASAKDKPQDAIKALIELERLDPADPQWSQRLGEAYRRKGASADAVEAYARAFVRYFEKGFLPRAIAMAKLVKSLDAERGDLLEKALPVGGVPPPLGLGRPVFPPEPGKAPEPPKKLQPPPLPSAALPKPARKPAPMAPPAVGPPARKPPPLPAEPIPLVTKRPPPLPAPLRPADDSLPDETRFEDAPESSIEIMLGDLHSVSAIDVDDIAEDDDGPPTRQLSDEPPRSRDHSSPDVQATMATVRLFGALTRDALMALSSAAELIEFVPNAMIIVRDERAFALYGIVSGTARVTLAGSSEEIFLEEGDVFGEAVLLDEGTRQANVRAETPLMTLRIEKQALDEAMKAYPEIEGALFDLLARRLIKNLVRSSPLFAAFDPKERLELAQRFEVRRAAAGTVLAERGRRSDGLYVLLAGTVTAEPEGGVAARIARGTAFGHGSLLGAGKSDVTIRAVNEAVLLRMPAAGFTEFAAQYPPVLAHLAETANEPLPMSRRQ